MTKTYWGNADTGEACATSDSDAEFLGWTVPDGGPHAWAKYPSITAAIAGAADGVAERAAASLGDALSATSARRTQHHAEPYAGHGRTR